MRYDLYATVACSRMSMSDLGKHGGDGDGGTPYKQMISNSPACSPRSTFCLCYDKNPGMNFGHSSCAPAPAASTPLVASQPSAGRPAPCPWPAPAVCRAVCSPCVDPATLALQRTWLSRVPANRSLSLARKGLVASFSAGRCWLSLHIPNHVVRET